jgi:hypothetical protein
MCTRPEAIIAAASTIAGPIFAGNFRVAQPKAAHRERLKDNV